MTIPREMFNCIDEAFNKAERYEEIKEICKSTDSDNTKLTKIKSIINEAEINLYENNYKFDNCRCRFDNYRNYNNYNNNVESLESIIRRIKNETCN